MPSSEMIALMGHKSKARELAASKGVPVLEGLTGDLSTLLENHLGITLFEKSGRNLALTETGRLVLSYADEIFSLGGELEEFVHQLPARLPQTLRIVMVEGLPQ